MHTPDYLERLREGHLDEDEEAQLEIRWSPEVVEGFRLMTGGTRLAAVLALCQPGEHVEERPGEPPYRHARGVGIHLGGGFHHACEDHGEGFCLFNDVAVAVRLLKRDGASGGRPSSTAMSTTATGRPSSSRATDRSSPSRSTRSTTTRSSSRSASLDIHLPDYTDDEGYLRHLAGALPRVFASGPDILFYLAGADPFEEDQLGGLSLTKEGLRRRDRMVFNAAKELGVPVVVTLAGGYARRVEDTVEIHAATIEEAIRMFGE